MFSKILLALDLTEQSRPAIDAVREIATGTTVVAVHVVVHALEPEQQRVAEGQVEELRHTGIDAHLELSSSLMGDEASAIAKGAEEYGSDVIIIACRGRSRSPARCSEAPPRTSSTLRRARFWRFP